MYLYYLWLLKYYLEAVLLLTIHLRGFCDRLCHRRSITVRTLVLLTCSLILFDVVFGSKVSKHCQ